MPKIEHIYLVSFMWHECDRDFLAPGTLRELLLMADAYK